MSQVQPSKICVFGLGMSGSSAARYLERMGQNFFVADTRIAPPEKDAVLKLSRCEQGFFGEIPQEKLNSAELIILSPGVSPQLPMLREALKVGAEIVGDIEIFARHTKAKIVAITGSNGKSTVTDLAYQLLKASGANVAVGGNFGIPVLDFLPEDNADIYVLELSSFQLDTTHSLAADVAVLLNISEDHMDRYDDFESYRHSKLSVFNRAKIAVGNADDCLTMPNELSGFITFSLTDQSARYHLTASANEKYLMRDSEQLFNVKDLQIAGMHNWSNALAALSIILELGVKLDAKILDVLARYEGLTHRYQLVKSANGIDWVNDSKATNVGATLAAIEGIDREIYSSVILIAGGDAKGADLTPLKSALENKVSHLIVLGRDAEQLAVLVDKEKVSYAQDMQHAVLLAKKNLQLKSAGKKCLVLLSPACASLDMYKNFAERGEAFKLAVEGIQ